MKAHFDPNTLYARGALIEMLEPMKIDPDAFIARIKPTKRFRMAWLGADLIEAMKSAPPLGEDASEDSAPSAPRQSGRRRGGADTGIAKLQAIIKGKA